MAPKQQKQNVQVVDMEMTELESLIAIAVKDAVQSMCAAIQDLKEEGAR